MAALECSAEMEKVEVWKGMWISAKGDLMHTHTTDCECPEVGLGLCERDQITEI